MTTDLQRKLDANRIFADIKASRAEFKTSEQFYPPRFQKTYKPSQTIDEQNDKRRYFLVNESNHG